MENDIALANGEIPGLLERVQPDPVDRVEITTLYENLIDKNLPRNGPVERLAPKGEGFSPRYRRALW